MDVSVSSKGDFLSHLSFGGKTAAVLRLVFHNLFPPHLEVGARSFHVTNDGKIRVTEDGGQTWKSENKFGPEFCIWGLTRDEDEDEVVAAMDYKGCSIFLCTTDGVLWFNHLVHHHNHEEHLPAND